MRFLFNTTKVNLILTAVTINLTKVEITYSYFRFKLQIMTKIHNLFNFDYVFGTNNT